MEWKQLLAQIEKKGCCFRTCNLESLCDIIGVVAAVDGVVAAGQELQQCPLAHHPAGASAQGLVASNRSHSYALVVAGMLQSAALPGCSTKH